MAAGNGTEKQGNASGRVIIYRREHGTRIGAGSDFAGKWEVKDAKFSSAPVMIIESYGNDGLSFGWPMDKEHRTSGSTAKITRTLAHAWLRESQVSRSVPTNAPLILSGQYASGPHPVLSAGLFLAGIVAAGYVFA